MRWLAGIILALLPVTAGADPLWDGDRGPVAVDESVLDRLLSGRETAFTLPLAGEEPRVEVRRIQGPNLGVTSLQGRFSPPADGSFLLCRAESGAVTAFFQPGDGKAWRLDHTTGRDALRQVEYAELGPCAGGVDLPALGGIEETPPGRIGEYPPRAVADDGSRHDILVGYTSRAETWVGGWDYIQLECQLAVDVANLAYQNSGIASSLRLVHIMPTDYEESTAWDYEDHVAYLYTPGDGLMDGMLEKRDIVGADFVSVLIDGQDSLGNVHVCGVAPVMAAEWLGPQFAPGAASIVSVQCAVDNWTLAHEVGHNRGCAHNREDAGIDGAFSHAYGHRWFASDGTGYRTVMAYDNAGEEYQRVPHFSHPEIDFQGEPTGVPVGQPGEAHNALVHGDTAPICAGFRVERTFLTWGWSNFSNGLWITPFGTLIDALGGSRDGGAIVLQNDNSGFVGVLDDPRSYVHEGSGSATLGGD